MVVVFKKNWTARYCVDYGKMQNITVRDTFLSPSMNACIDSLQDAQVILTSDEDNVKCQVEFAK